MSTAIPVVSLFVDEIDRLFPLSTSNSLHERQLSAEFHLHSLREHLDRLITQLFENAGYGEFLLFIYIIDFLFFSS
jgi:hypothetical protein